MPAWHHHPVCWQESSRGRWACPWWCWEGTASKRAVVGLLDIEVGWFVRGRLVLGKQGIRAPVCGLGQKRGDMASRQPVSRL